MTKQSPKANKFVLWAIGITFILCIFWLGAAVQQTIIVKSIEKNNMTLCPIYENNIDNVYNWGVYDDFGKR
jgi:amino acid permease